MMSFHMLVFLISLVFLVLQIEATQINNTETLTEEPRKPRVNGRIVKLYSGSRPEPFFCPTEGFHLDPADCAVFYRCVKAANGKYTVFRFQCGPGTVYDPDTEVCNHPRSTKRSECGGSVSPSIPQNHENEIDRSEQEIPSPISTKKPVYTEQTTLLPAYPWATSTKRQHFEAPTSTVSTAHPWITTTTASKSPPPPRRPSSQNGEPCISDGFMGDSENCRKFYRCVGNQRGSFIRYEFSCSESTIWDEDSQSCNHPWAVQKRRCGRGNSQDNKPSSTIEQSTNNEPNMTIQQQTQINYGSKVSQTQSQISNGTVKQNQTQINYGDRLNQNNGSGAKQNQTQISYGSAISQSQTQIDYGNKGVQTQLQVDHTKQSSQTQTQVYESNTKTTTISSQNDEQDNGYGAPFNADGEGSNEKDNNGNECTESGFMGDKNDCKKFYRCVDNGKGGYTKYEFSCGEGTVWDAKTEACNHVWAVKECGGKSPVNNTTQSEPPPTTTTKTTTQNYYVSSEQTTTEVDEEISYGNSNLQSTSTTSMTLTTSTVQPKPITNENSETVCMSSGFIGDENDCKKFYRCVDNGGGSYTKYEFKCGEGTVWDSDIEACNHAWAVKKCGGSSSENDINKTENTTNRETSTMTTASHKQTTTQTSAQNIDYETGYDQQNNASPSTTTTTKQPQTGENASSSTTITTKQPQTGGESDGSNECTTSGFMGDKNDCKKFYRCVDNGKGAYTRYEFSCGEGTVWDPKVEACNHAWAVEKCGADESSDIHKETTVQPNSTMSDEEIVTSNTPQNETEPEYPPTQSTTSSSSSTTDLSTLDKGNECQTSGFMGDKKDCKKFYRCVDNGKGGYTRYEFSCGEGTVWDQSIEGCNHAWSVDNCGSEGNHSSQTQYETTSQIYGTSTLENEDQGYDHPTSEKTTTSTGETSHTPEREICVKEGFVGDRKDCKKFYRCVDNGRGGYLKYEFSCGEGTVWDPDINTCNHPSPDRNCGVSESESVSKVPDRENDETYTENGTSMSTASTENGDNAESTEKLPNSTANSICKSEGFYGDPNNCKKFYRCVDNGNGGYTKYDFICGDGTIWDQKIQSCNHESSNSECSRVPPTGSETQETEYYTSPKPESTKNPESTGETKAPPSNSKCTSEGFYANSEDCKKFFRCVSNDNGGYTKYDFTCGQGTVWVQEIQTCDHDNGMSNCSMQSGTTAQFVDEQQSTTSASLTSSESTQSQKPDKEDDEYSNENPSESTSLSGEQCSSEGFYANKRDCKRFYRCVDNGHGGYTKYEFTCGEGTAWDSEIQSCNHINEVNSCQDSHQEESQSKPGLQDEGTPESSETTTKTSTSSSSTENTQTDNKDKCKQEGYFGNTEDCKKFYRCVDNGKGGFTKYDYTCGEGTIWDQDITTCNHPQDVSNPSCKQSDGSTSSTTSSPSSTTGSSSQSTSSTDESSSQASSNCSQENSTKKPVNQNVTCTKAGYYADSNDCKKFYRCVDWDGDGKRFSVYHFDCGEGTIWDPALDTCNHEDSVYPPRDCSGAQSQNENVNSESSTTEDMTSDQTTTQKTTTSEQTTQQTTTSEQTTAQQTTSKQTTTQQTTTSEQTTSQQTTSEQTTSQETTSEQTTSQQTTSEQTTIQQTTTSEPTTTQQTISEQTTTQQTTTSEQTTTQQTTSEQTTAHQTASEQTTATSEQTTTQQTTTSEKTTTQQATTSEQTTTQQATTSEQTTAQQTSSEQTTTQRNPSEQTTSQQSTTEQTTTQSSEGEETTTQQQSSTTEQSTTTEKNDQQNSTEQSSNTEETTTHESTTEQQSSTHESQTTEDSTSTTSQQTDESSTTESGQDTTESSSSSNKDCPETENDQNLFVCPTSFRRHPKYCNLFYQCTEDDDNHDVKIAVFNCPNNTIYDESKTKCVQEDKADKKCDGEIAQRRRVKRLDATYKEPIVISQEILKCPAVGYFPFENEECSSVFLKCSTTKSSKLRGFVYQCPEGYVYWSVSKRCEAKSNVRFCKKSYNNWNGRWEIPIERRNVAP